MADMDLDIRVDALLRRLYVPATPDEHFITASATRVAASVRAARRQDATWYGRLMRDYRLAIDLAREPATRRWLQVAGLAVLVALVLVVALIVAGAITRPRPLGNGPIIASVGGQLQAIDPGTGSARLITGQNDQAVGVSRSPDGRLATFWVDGPDRSRLYVVDVTGGVPRELAVGLPMSWSHTSDAWSPDSRSLATSVTLSGAQRIVVVDTTTGAVTPLTPPDVAAVNQLWSPDGRHLVFGHEKPSGHTLAVIGADRSGMHDLSGLDGLDVNGPDTWSPDGEWIYFGAADMKGDQHAYRLNLSSGSLTLLSRFGQTAPAAVSSPDGAMVLFNVDASYGFDLWIANSDGTHSRLLLPAGGIGSWASDSSLILVRWRPQDRPGGLATIRPDGKDATILVPFAWTCRQDWTETCESGYGWGVAQP